MTDAPDRIFAFDYDLQDDDGTWRNWKCWDELHPAPLNAIEYIRRDAVCDLPEVKALVEALEVQTIWVRAALDCKEWAWDALQAEAAEESCAAARAALADMVQKVRK